MNLHRDFIYVSIVCRRESDTWVSKVSQIQMVSNIFPYFFVKVEIQNAAIFPFKQYFKFCRF